MEPFVDEQSLCRAYISSMQASGYKCYPEVDYWDLVLVGGSSRRLQGLPTDDLQLGVQAKLKPDYNALLQCLKNQKSPPWRYVLIGKKPSSTYMQIAAKLGVGVIYPDSYGNFCHIKGKVFPACSMDLPTIIAPSVVAGAPSPRSLTKWRERALKICIIAQDKGFLTSADFRSVGLSMTLWVKKKWVVNTGQTEVGKNSRKHAIYRLGETNPGQSWEREIEMIRTLKSS